MCRCPNKGAKTVIFQNRVCLTVWTAGVHAMKNPTYILYTHCFHQQKIDVFLLVLHFLLCSLRAINQSLIAVATL